MTVLLLVLAVLSCASNALGVDWPETIQTGHEGHETMLVQSLINEANSNQSLVVDGDFGNGTKSAVKAFQLANGLDSDGIVGPQTWTKLFASRERYVIRFKKTSIPANDPSTPENDSLYECKVTRQLINSDGIQASSAYRGSVQPNNLDTHGRIKDGFYVLQLGLHKRQGLTPTADDLEVKTTGTLRPCLVVNRDSNVPVISNDPNKTESNAIHIHNGFNTERGSEGCQTITPSKWSDFIKHFLNKHSALSDWSIVASGTHTYRGREIGVLVVQH